MACFLLTWMMLSLEGPNVDTDCAGVLRGGETYVEVLGVLGGEDF